MSNHNLSNQGKVGVIAAFKMSNGMYSYKGCEFSKEDFHKAFAEAATHPVSSNEILGKLISLPEEFLLDWKFMDTDTANLLAEAVLHSESAANYIASPSLDDIGFGIHINPFSEQALEVNFYEEEDWYRVKSNIIKGCEGDFTEIYLQPTNE